MGDQLAIADGTSTTAAQSAGSYGDWQNICPFFVGQEVEVSRSIAAAPATSIDSVITSIKYQGDNTANPPTNQSKVFITLNPPIYSNTSGGAQDVTGIKIKAKTTAVLTNVINRAELVLTLTEESPDEEIDYITYTTEEDNGNSLTSFQRQYLAEPSASALFVACCNNGQILPNRTFESYRYAVDNEERTGNRDVVFGQPLHFDRLQRCLDSQVGLGFKNAQLKFYRSTESQANAYAAPVSMICETLEETQENKKVALQIECTAGLEQIILYKSMAKVLKK
jgi:hypothetical protein